MIDRSVSQRPFGKQGWKCDPCGRPLCDQAGRRTPTEGGLGISTALLVIDYLVIAFLSVDLSHLVSCVRSPLTLLVALAVVAVLLPGRVVGQEWLKRHFSRQKYDSGLMLQRLSRQMAP